MRLLLDAIVSGLIIGGIYGLASVGLSMVFGVLRVVNFAHGALIVLGMYVAWATFKVVENVMVSGLAAILAMGLLGALAYWLFLRRQSNEQLQLITTLGIALIIQSLLLLVAGPENRTLTGGISADAVTLPGGIAVGRARVVAALVGGTAMVILGLWVRRTTSGRAIRAVVDDADMARMCGIDVSRAQLLVFAVGTALGALAGTAIALFDSFSPSSGTDLLLIAFVVVVMGGLGSVAGTAIAGLVIGVVEAVSQTFWSLELADVAVFVVFVAVLLLRPEGFFGEEIT